MAHDPIRQLTHPSKTADKRATFLGLRVSALKEVLLFICAALIIDFLIGTGDRYASLSPHPFWIAVLLSATYYGTNEGLVAAALSTAALLIGNMPDQAINEDLAAWLLRITTQPVLWFVTALVLGELCVARRQESERLHEEVQQIQAQADVVAKAYEQMAQSQHLLEMHIASQQRTVRRLAAAAQAIEQPTQAEVLRNVPEMVRVVFSPQKFSVYLAQGRTLELISEEGWQPSDPYWRRIAQGPLLEAIMDRREILVVSDPAQERSLCGQGMMAAPLIEHRTGTLIGMLKIEKVHFHELNLSTLMDFAAICNWIGHACERANRLEDQAQASRAAEAPLPFRDINRELGDSLVHVKHDRLSSIVGRTAPADDPERTQVEIDADRGSGPAAKRRSNKW